MSKNDTDTTIQELKELVIKFGAERNWQRHHTPKNLAMGIAIEAAELMEHFQWERGGEPDKTAVGDELADVMFNILNFAQSQDIDIVTSFKNKYKKLLVKYPVEKFNQDSDDLTDYWDVKKAYRNQEKS